jgi:hypothetical protein
MSFRTLASQFDSLLEKFHSKFPRIAHAFGTIHDMFFNICMKCQIFYISLRKKKSIYRFTLLMNGFAEYCGNAPDGCRESGEVGICQP